MLNLLSETRLMWGMPITVAIVETVPSAGPLIAHVFAYFEYIDDKFSTYKPSSEISLINLGAVDHRRGQR